MIFSNLLLSFLFALFAIHTVVKGALISSRTKGELKINSSDYPNVPYNVDAFLENEMNKDGGNCGTIFVNKLSIDGKPLGPRFYTKVPETKTYYGVKYFLVSYLHFFDENEASGVSRNDEKSVEAMKKRLVNRKIFKGRTEHILVSNVIVGEKGYGPILLPAEFEDL